jgi:transposase-like protein
MISAKPSDGPPAGAAAVVPKLPVTLDTKGRVRVRPEQRRQLLAEFARSGESAPSFARRLGLKYSTFAAWVLRARRSRRPQVKPPLRLLEAVVAPAPTSLPLVVQLPGQARAELRDASHIPLVVALVRALEQPC